MMVDIVVGVGVVGYSPKVEIPGVMVVIVDSMVGIGDRGRG